MVTPRLYLLLALVSCTEALQAPWFVKTETFKQALSFPQIRPHLEAHKTWVAGLRAEGQCITSGYRVDADGAPGGGGLMLFAAEDYAAAEEIVQCDPLVANGCVDWQLNQWVADVGDVALIDGGAWYAKEATSKAAASKAAAPKKAAPKKAASKEAAAVSDGDVALVDGSKSIIPIDRDADGITGGGDGGVSGRRDGGEEGAVYDRSSDDATATARAWYAKKAATSPKKRGPPPMMSAAAANGAAPRVVLEPDYRLAGALAGGAGLVTLGIPLGLGVPLGVPLAALGALLASRTNTARLVFDVGQPVKRVSLAGGIACYPATPGRLGREACRVGVLGRGSSTHSGGAPPPRRPQWQHTAPPSTNVAHLAQVDALEVMTATPGAEDVRASGENFAVGGLNRWAYTDIVEWALYPTAEAPALVYFRERQTRPEGQGHLFPVLFSPDVLLQELEQRVGSDRRVMGAPRLL